MNRFLCVYEYLFECKLCVVVVFLYGIGEYVMCYLNLFK